MCWKPRCPTCEKSKAFLEKLGHELDLRDVEYAAVNGMLRTLDPHTSLLTPDVFEEMRMSTHGEFGGLGIVISIRDGNLTVIRPMPNTPASRGGLERGDRIVKIDAESTLNMPLAEAVSRLRGEPGSPVDVWFTRATGTTWSAPRRVRLVRDTSLKYPLVRVEDELVRSAQGDKRIRVTNGSG